MLLPYLLAFRTFVSGPVVDPPGAKADSEFAVDPAAVGVRRGGRLGRGVVAGEFGVMGATHA